MKTLAGFELMVGSILLVGQAAFAADPAPEPAPVPKKLPVETIGTPIPLELTFPPPVSKYDVWQNYGVDSRGYFKPRVIYSPSVPYYLYNGKPYWYTTTRSRSIQPFLVD